jgi:hypothetical protein
MDLFIALTWFAALVLLGWVLQSTPVWVARLWTKLTEVTPPAPGSEPLDLTLQSSLFSGPFIRERLDALHHELQQLDRDPVVFAKAFHTIAARSAYDALVADATKVTVRPHHRVGEVVEIELAGASDGTYEVLER